MEDVTKEMGERIKKLRESKGFTQQELADALSQKCSCKRTSVAMWETGERQPRTDQLIVLSELLDASCDFILRGIDSSNLDMCKVTGLSNGAVNILKSIKKEQNSNGAIGDLKEAQLSWLTRKYDLHIEENSAANLLSTIIESSYFESIVDVYSTYLNNLKALKALCQPQENRGVWYTSLDEELEESFREKSELALFKLAKAIGKCFGLE